LSSQPRRAIVSHRKQTTLNNVAALGNEDSWLRRAAARALGELGDRRAVQPLSRALEDLSYTVRQGAAYALGRLADADSVDPLAAALEDSIAVVRLAAARALGRVGGPAVVSALAKALKDDWHDVRASATRSLGAIGTTDVLGPLGEALKDEIEEVRIEAMRALANLEDGRALSLLVPRLDDRYAAAFATKAVAHFLRTHPGTAATGDLRTIAQLDTRFEHVDYALLRELAGVELRRRHVSP